MVLVTVASMLLDKFVYRVQLPATKWLAAGAVLALLVHLFTGTADEQI